MWNKKRILLIAAIIFFIGLIGSFATYASVPKQETVSKVISEDFEQIDIVGQDAEIYIYPTNDRDAKIEVTGRQVEDKLSAEVVAEKLSIAYQNKTKKFYNFGLDLFTVKIKLYVPKKQYESVTVKADNGKIAVEQLAVDSLDIQASNGQVIANEISGDTVNLAADNGEIKYTDAQVAASKVTTNNGKLSINDVVGEITARADNGAILYRAEDITAPLDFATNNGKIQLTTDKKPENTEIFAQVENGIITIYGEKTAYVKYGEGRYPVHLQADNGKISVGN